MHGGIGIEEHKYMPIAGLARLENEPAGNYPAVLHKTCHLSTGWYTCEDRGQPTAVDKLPAWFVSVTLV